MQLLFSQSITTLTSASSIDDIYDETNVPIPPSRLLAVADEAVSSDVKKITPIIDESDESVPRDNELFRKRDNFLRGLRVFSILRYY